MTLPPLFDGNFPTFVKETVKGVINVYWYDIEFSQSRYPPGQKKSAACTVICIFIAQQISKTKIIIQSEEYCKKLNLLLAEAMVKGNAAYERIISQRLVPHIYLNAEEALKYGGESFNILTEWGFRIFHEDMSKNLHKNIEDVLHHWYCQPLSQNLFMLLITGGRTVLFVFQQITSKVTVFDSHSHSTSQYPNRGLVLAQANINQLKLLCEWFIQDISIGCFNDWATEYELTFLYPDESKL